MRSIFIGESRFSRAMLETLLGAGREILAVVSRPLRGGDDEDELADFDVPIHWRTEDINKDSGRIRDLKPDLIYCLGFRQILRREILDICPVIGFHPSPLPKMRGHHPIVWALVLKMKETASSFFLMDSGADSGDLLSQKPVPILEGDTVRNLYDRIIETAKGQILELDIHKRTPQDHSQATYLRKRVKGKEDTWLEY